jgi:phosphate transport system substrate-binding protein
MFPVFRTVLIAASALITCAAHGTEIKGAGSSAAQPLYAVLAVAYAQSHPMTLAYQPSGSSDGLKKIKANLVDFGASDVALSASEREAAKLLCFPTAISGVVPIVNIAGVRKGQLKLTGDVLADIFARKILRWNDPRVAALNAGIKLPDQAITVIVRSDGSGTTYNFTSYLSKASKDWSVGFGHDFSIKWPAGVVPAKGSGGVVSTFKSTPGAIAYVDFHYVKQDALNYSMLKNRDGRYVQPDAAGFSAALKNSSWTRTGAYEELLTDQAGPSSWPITAGTFILVPRQSPNPEATIATLKFFTWAFVQGEAAVGKADFVQLPDKVQGRIFGELSAVTDSAGVPLRWSLSEVLKLR